MPQAAQRLDKVVPFRAIRRSLKDTAERAEQGDPIAQNVLINAAAMRPELFGIGPENLGLRMDSGFGHAPGRNPLLAQTDEEPSDAE